MVASDLLIPHLTQRIIDQGIVPGNGRVVVVTALIMVGAALLSAALAAANNFLSVNVAMSFGADIRSVPDPQGTVFLIRQSRPSPDR